MNVEHHEQNIKTYAHDLGVSEEQAEKELRVEAKLKLNSLYGRMVNIYHDTDSIKDKSSCMYDLFDTHL